MKIGFFDSGVGGYMMMEYCSKKFPGPHYVSLADAKNAPYGPKRDTGVYQNVKQCLLYMIEVLACDRVYIACNTASISCYRLFLDEYPDYSDYVIDIVKPTKEYFQLRILEGDLITLGTQKTVRSDVYAGLVVSGDIYAVPAPGLVDCAESNNISLGTELIDSILINFSGLDYGFLACTHFSYYKEYLTQKYPHIEWIDQHQIVADDIGAFLESCFREGNDSDHTLEYYTTAEISEHRNGIKVHRVDV